MSAVFTEGRSSEVAGLRVFLREWMRLLVPRSRHSKTSMRDANRCGQAESQARLGDNQPTSGKILVCLFLFQDFHFLYANGVGMPEMHIELVKA
jgi:hypothetical protein